ncbi:MAG: enoyl-CoA hydratase/isomerase family protein [Micromonosporaceae bacterium]
MIEREDADGVAIVRLAYGPVNALDLDLLGAITETFRGLDRDGHTAVVFTGAGRAFCAGVDLWRMVEGESSYVERFLPALVDAFDAVFSCGKPVVAALNGHAIAGGCIFAAAADRRIMAAGRGRIGVSELLVGVPFPVAGLEILRHAVGEPGRQDLVLTGATHEPDEALRRGIVDEVVPADRLPDRALEVARQLAEIPGDTYRLTKTQLRRDALDRIARRWPAERAEVTELWCARIADGWIRRYMERVTRR